MKHVLVVLLGMGLVAMVIAKDGEATVLKVNSKNWNIENGLKWTQDGFKLQSRNFGAIETKQRLEYNPDNNITLTIKSVSKNSNYTIQLHLFDKKGRYLGHIDLLKESRKIGAVKVELADFKNKINKKTNDFAIKLWLGGSNGKKLAVSEVKYGPGQ